MIEVSLTFDFNKEKVEKDGFTTDDLLKPMRDHAKKYGIDEPKYGVFTMTGENAMCRIGMFIIDITDANHAYISYFNTWLFNVCGNIEDCIAAVKRRYAKKGIKQLDTMTSVT